MKRLLLLAFVLAALVAPAGERTAASNRTYDGNIEIIRDIPFAGTTNPKQTLDLLLPRERHEKLPLIVFIHGGAWIAGDKQKGYVFITPLVRSGRYAAATINYRLSDEAIWPAQIHDCKAAIRWLRGNAAEFGIDPDRVAVWGTSAGGHLVAMLGVSGGDAILEGSLGRFTNESSRVSCVVDFFGPTDFFEIPKYTNILHYGTAGALDSRLLGGTVFEKPDAARSASPIMYDLKQSPPFFIAHGTKDRVVPFSQSEIFFEALKKAGTATPPIFIHVVGAGHGFNIPEVNARVGQFLDLHLYGKKSEISSEPVNVSRW
jgi:acetyl esterase/lipase